MINVKILAVMLVIFSGMSASAVHGFQRDAAGSSSGLRGGGQGSLTESRVLQEDQQCELTLKKMCVSGGNDGWWDFLSLEIYLEIYHADSNGVGHWEGFTKEPFVFLPLNGCIDINKDVSPIGSDIEVRVKEFDLFSTASVGTKFEEVCQDVSNGQNLEFATKHGTFTFVLDKKGVLNVDEVSDYLVSEWPGSPSLLLTHLLEFTADRKYRILPDSLADKIWNDSGLGNMTWTESVFDCDDFATVYKAAALKAGYTAGSDYSYAAWMISGYDYPNRRGHSTIVYINEYMQVKVLEPQNGSVVFGQDWDYTPFIVVLL